ncbi:selenocysteine-specific translation elongation factor [Microvirgula aerodenitrificans]|uniref:selenocysteine-specific translation elongation factor n=1 Tax=Microvirgula aerodenitrificans TaxID=57480 RepID=UPI00048F97AB|nr:selenocysteine-specific translation elongation factor [Microvirgula aerodenitrificans]
MIIATAGHVDHGKTALVRALTGTDADRLPEEKKRGMTIDLGYAYLPLADGRSLGFIDVPGHEKFLTNMLAGVAGIDYALLIVACDDGVMPQTREHLAILHLLGLTRASVVLSKRDLVNDARHAEVAAEVRALLAPTRLADSPLFTVASLDGSGIDALRDHLVGLPASQSARETRRFRHAIDRAFTLTGSGLVVTGTAFSGRVAVGDTVWLTGRNRPLRVRSLHAQNRATDSAHAGQRVAVNLAGDVEKTDISRGDWLLAAAPPAATDRVTLRLDASLDLATPLAHWQTVHVHHAASHVTGRIALLDRIALPRGESALAELALDTPLHLADNDRLILRDASARQTLAGATVIELAPPSRGKRTPARLAALRELVQVIHDDNDTLRCRAQTGAVSLTDFAWARQLDARQLATLPALAGLKVTGRDNTGNAYSPAHWQALQERVLSRLQALHDAQPDQLGAGRGRLRRLAVPTETDAAADALFDDLLADGRLQMSRGFLHLPGHVLSFDAREAADWARLQPWLGDGWEPRWVRDLAGDAGLDEAGVRLLMKKAARLGHVTAIVPDRYYPSQTIERLAAIASELAGEQGQVDAASFRDAIGVGRKLAIQILEFFDRSGFLRRQGDAHRLRDTRLF